MNRNQEFDIHDYINKRMLEIKQLEDRGLYKEIVGGILAELYQYNQKSYQELETKILNECRAEQQDYSIYTCITDARHYDATDSFLFPMMVSDTKKTEPSYEELSAALKQGQEFKLYTIFLEAAVSDVYRILHRDKPFRGIIETAKGRYEADIVIRRNDVYMDMVKDLYDVFGLNYLKWRTVCEAYLTKMLDVFVLPIKSSEKPEKILEVYVDFEMYSPKIHYNMIPLWNLKTVEKKTSSYPEPSIDKINYEHRIFARRLNPNCLYLIKNMEAEIMNIRRLNGDLYITCPYGNQQEWELYQISKMASHDRYLYPILSNQCKESFSGAITDLYARSIKTKGEVARLIESFNYDNYVVFQDIRVLDTKPESWMENNYNMDGFILDEIRIGNSRQILSVKFKPVDPEDFLNEDIMSFLVTKIQTIFPEYLCIGELV